MPNMAIYLDDKTYWKFFLLSDEKQKEIKVALKNLVKENTKETTLEAKND